MVNVWCEVIKDMSNNSLSACDVNLEILLHLFILSFILNYSSVLIFFFFLEKPHCILSHSKACFNLTCQFGGKKKEQRDKLAERSVTSMYIVTINSTWALQVYTVNPYTEQNVSRILSKGRCCFSHVFYPDKTLYPEFVKNQSSFKKSLLQIQGLW